ncbi:MAG: hypothetical protein SFU98_21155 [Leptospiraceae bacterium]|nr:hypothetical protein [Leptospiraceae bacterium]
MIKKILALLTFCLVLNCFNALSKQEYPKKRYFVLEANEKERPKFSNKLGGLKINKFKISPFYDSKLFVYRLTSANYDTDYYNEFMVFPAINVTEIISKWIFDSGIAENQPFSAEEIPFQLTGSVNSLYGDFRDKKNSFAVLEIEIFLQSAKDKKIVLKKSYKLEKKLKDQTPEELVKGWNSGLTEILLELSSDLNKL